MFAVGLANFTEDSIAYLFKGVLAVVGGYAVGFVFGFLVAKGFDRYIVRTVSPHSLHTAVKHTCGIIAAIIVALIYFESGKGNGGGEGPGDGTKPGDTQATGGTLPTTATTSSATKPEPPPVKFQIAEAVKVRIAFGNDVEPGTEKFFQVNDAAEKTDLAGVKAAVKERKLAAKGQVVIVYEFAPTASERTYPWTVLNGAKESLEAPLLTPKQYAELLAKQP
jgi:hypothetical protein